MEQAGRMKKFACQPRKESSCIQPSSIIFVDPMWTNGLLAFRMDLCGMMGILEYRKGNIQIR